MHHKMKLHLFWNYLPQGIIKGLIMWLTTVGWWHQRNPKGNPKNVEHAVSLDTIASPEYSPKQKKLNPNDTQD